MKTICSLVTTILILLSAQSYSNGALGLRLFSNNPAWCQADSPGSISALTSNGTAPYQYKLDNGNSITYNYRSYDFLSVPMGMHTIYVKDSNGLADTSLITLSVEPGWNISALVTDAAQGISDGSIDVVASGIHLVQYGFGYSIQSGVYQNTSFFGGLSSGNYIIHVTDYLCDTTLHYTIQSGNSPLAAKAVSISGMCDSTMIASTTVYASGGVPPYQYKVNGRYYKNSNCIDSLLPGNIYAVTVKDSVGNTYSLLETIDSAGFSRMALGWNVYIRSYFASSGQANGSFVCAATGIDSPYHYSTVIPGLGAVQNTSGVFSNLPAGQYRVFISNSNSNCDTVINVLVGAINSTNNVTDIYAHVLHIQPNPTHGAASVRADNIIIELSITNLEGRELLNNKAINSTIANIDISGFCAGVYFVNVKTESGIGISKLVIEK